MEDRPPKRSVPGRKDENGQYVAPPEPTVDLLLRDGLTACQCIMDSILLDAKHGTPSREVVQNLKDVMAILQEYKKRQVELLEDVTPEELAAELARRKES